MTPVRSADSRLGLQCIWTHKRRNMFPGTESGQIRTVNHRAAELFGYEKGAFTGAEKELVKTDMRYRGIIWGDANMALLTEGLQGKQRARASKLNPATGATEVLFDRSTNDRYSDPGSPVTRRNQYDRNVMLMVNNGTGIAMTGQGASADGDLPFYSVFDLATKKTNKELAEKLTVAMNQLKESGELEKIFAKYGVKYMRP